MAKKGKAKRRSGKSRAVGGGNGGTGGGSSNGGNGGGGSGPEAAQHAQHATMCDLVLVQLAHETGIEESIHTATLLEHMSVENKDQLVAKLLECMALEDQDQQLGTNSEGESALSTTRATVTTSTTAKAIMATTPTTTNGYENDHNNWIIKPELGMLIALECTHEQARTLITFACILIGDVIRRSRGTKETLPKALMDRLRKLVIDRNSALHMANDSFSKRYKQEEWARSSIMGHAAMLCAHEYMGRCMLTNQMMAVRAIKAAVEVEHGSLTDAALLFTFVDDWLLAHTTEHGAVLEHEMDGIQVGDRLFDLQVHFAKNKRWPRTIHGTRVMPFGCSDLSDKTKFGDGESKRACLSCHKEFGTARGWREHLLLSGEHDVYLCCGQQFVDLEAVLEHLIHAHEGKLGRLEPLVQREKPPMDLWE